jgi:hypothetical protein
MKQETKSQQCLVNAANPIGAIEKMAVRNNQRAIAMNAIKCDQTDWEH